LNKIRFQLSVLEEERAASMLIVKSHWFSPLFTKAA